MATVFQGADPWFLNQLITSDEARAAMVAGFVAQSGAVVMPVAGVVPGNYGTGLFVSQTSPTGMKVNVSAGQCVIPRSGSYGWVCTLPTVATVDLAASNATNPRYDTIVARVRDSTLSDGSNGVWSNGFGIEVITGTPAASPTIPTVPAGALRLADVYVAANATTITNDAPIYDRRVFTVSAGGVRYAYNALSAAPNMPYDLRVTDTGDLEMHNNLGTPAGWKTLTGVGGWTSYTPSWTGLTSQGTTNLEVIGRYRRLGSVVHVYAHIKGGTGASLGTGAIFCTLPFPGTVTSTNIIHTGQGVHSTSAGFQPLAAFLGSSNATQANICGFNSSRVWSSPGSAGYTFVAGDSMRFNLTYEATV